MRRSQRLIAATVLAAIAVALAGCSTGSFDPTDALDWFDTKKKIPGERRPVFPEGVPGVEQGVPRDMYKGAHQEPSPVVEAPPPAPEPTRAPAARSAARDAEPFPKPIDENKPPPIKRKRTRITAPDADHRQSAPPPQQAAPAQQQQAAPQQQAPSSFPAPLPSGGFAR